MYKLTFDLPAGIRVRDKIYNVTGIITSRIERINGCIQYFIQPPRKEDGTEIDAMYSDIENLEVIDNLGIEVQPETIEFEYQTGDLIRNKVNTKKGYIIVRRMDLNGCIGYWFESGEQNPKTGKLLEFYGFETELELIHSGLNEPNKPITGIAPEEDLIKEPVKKARTGCVSIQAPPK